MVLHEPDQKTNIPLTEPLIKWTHQTAGTLYEAEKMTSGKRKVTKTQQNTK